MLARVLHEIRSKADQWDADVARRRLITAVDPVADTRAYDAQELRALADEIDATTVEIGTEEYAKLHNTTPQSVRKWIKAGKLKARSTPNGWVILRDAPAPRRRRGRRS